MIHAKKPVPHAPREGERLAKRVAEMVPCSRREAEQYIEGGWVSVNGQVVEEPMFRVSDHRVEIDPDASLLELCAVTLLLHKPPGSMPWQRSARRIDKSNRRSNYSAPPRTPPMTRRACDCSSATLPSSRLACRWRPPPASWWCSPRTGACCANSPRTLS